MKPLISDHLSSKPGLWETWFAAIFAVVVTTMWVVILWKCAVYLWRTLGS